MRATSVFFLSITVIACASQCPNLCSGHGLCINGLSCGCQHGWTGGDCSLRLCPGGIAWADVATADDTAHAANAECSNAGSCDRATGLCVCRSGFHGVACERMSCPGSGVCSGHGRCLTMRDAAAFDDGRLHPGSFAYSHWDADKITGCVCDPGYTGYDCSIRMCPSGDDPLTAGTPAVQTVQTVADPASTLAGTFTLAWEGFTSTPISVTATDATVAAAITALDPGIGTIAVTRTAPTAETLAWAVTFSSRARDTAVLVPDASGVSGGGVSQDVTVTATTAQSGLHAPEVQVLSCTCPATCSGTLQLGFRGHFATVAHDAAPAAVKSALESLPTVRAIAVAGLGGAAAICGPTATATAITFTHSPGNVPLLQLFTSTLASSGGTPSVSITDDASAHYAAQAGTTEDEECSRHGTCDRATGKCACDSGWGASDGAGGAGSVPDCGYATATPTACPVAIGTTCAGHGTCSGAPEYSCTCVSGWRGRACDERVCVRGTAWWDAATADDTAHARGAECSNVGSCDRATGLCSCLADVDSNALFQGPGCQRLACPRASAATCAARGRCQTMATLAAAASFVYGGAASSLGATWDADIVQGCSCDGGHSLRRGSPTGFACEKRGCPFGDDPVPGGGLLEVQKLACDATAGHFRLAFRGHVTRPIFTTASATTGASSLQARLQSLPSVSSVDVSFDHGGAAVCAGGGSDVRITFTGDFGDLPTLATSDTSSLSGGTVTTSAVTDGTKQSIECSGRGICNTKKGVCDCFPGYGASDGSGGEGTRSDCGATLAISP